MFLPGRRAGPTGFAGVVALLGTGFHGHARELLGAEAVLLSAPGYAATALACRRRLADAPAPATITPAFDMAMHLPRAMVFRADELAPVARIPAGDVRLLPQSAVHVSQTGRRTTTTHLNLTW